MILEISSLGLSESIERFDLLIRRSLMASTSPYATLFSNVLPVYLIIILGWIAAKMGMIKYQSADAIDSINSFIFNVCVPAQVLQYLAQENLLDWSYWKYVASFLIVHYALGVFCFVYAYFTSSSSSGSHPFIPRFAALWMSMTWISSIVLGLPVLVLLYGDAQVQVYPILSVLGLIWLELPLYIGLLQYHNNNVNSKANEDVRKIESVNRAVEHITPRGESEDNYGSQHLETDSLLLRDVTSASKSTSHNSSTSGSKVTFLLSIAKECLSDPTILAAILGTILGLTVPGKIPTGINNALNQLASVVVGGALFMLGVWCYENLSLKSVLQRGGCLSSSISASDATLAINNSEGSNENQTSGPNYDFNTVSSIIVCLIGKFILSPVLMTSVCYLLDITGIAARAAVICASVPISSMSFVFSHLFGYGKEIVALNIVIGTALMFGVLAALLAVFDRFEMFDM